MISSNLDYSMTLNSRNNIELFQNYFINTYISQKQVPSIKNQVHQTDFKSDLIIAFLPAIIIIGIIGNLFNIVLFNSKAMKKCTTFRYLFYLSIFDLLVITICAPDAFLRFKYEIEVRLYSDTICRLHTFFTYFLTHASSTILMIISIDRALIINNRNVFVKALRYKKYEESDKREPCTLSCGSSICCILNCGIIKNSSKKFKSLLDRNNLIIICILVLLALLNSHYIFYMCINAHFAGSNSFDLLINKTEEINLVRLINKKYAKIEYCYPNKGLF